MDSKINLIILMKKLVFKLWFLVGFLFTTIAIAQNTPYDLLNPSMKEIATSESEPNWIKFKASAKINPQHAILR